MNECKEHKYRVQGEITDDSCPYCKIDRLTKQLAELDTEIKRTGDTESASIALASMAQINDDLKYENTTLRTKLAECEKEVERLKEVQGICEVCEVEAIKHADKARKQAAMECLERIKYQSYYQLEEWLKKHFGLKGVRDGRQRTIHAATSSQV